MAQLIDDRPALVLVIGDFIYDAGQDPSVEINKAVELVRPLTQAGIPTYAVLGNHDYGMKSKQAPPDEQLAAKLHAALEAVGVQVLKNEVVALASLGNHNQTIPKAAGQI